MKVWGIGIDEKNLINESINNLLEYFKDDDSIDMIFIHITNSNGFLSSLVGKDDMKDFVINVVCAEKNNVTLSDGAFKNLVNIQKYVEATFAYLCVWNNDEKTLNLDVFKKMFASSFLIIEREGSTKYHDMWKSLQDDPSIPKRESFLIDFSDNLLPDSRETQKRLTCK